MAYPHRVVAVAPDSDLYTTRILKASGALAETNLLLSQWDEHLSATDNMTRFQQENILGKASRARARDMVTRTFKHRYLDDADVLAALVTLARNRTPAETLDRILYFLTAQSDLLLHDLVIQVLEPRVYTYRQEITVDEVIKWIERQVAARRTESSWSESTSRRVAQGLLAALRDFGLLEGRNKKRLIPVYLPTTSFAFIAFLLHRRGAAGTTLLHHADWKLFFLSHEAVERFFFEAHQDGLLQFHVAGPVVRIDFPTTSPQEYASVITQRAY